MLPCFLDSINALYFHHKLPHSLKTSASFISIIQATLSHSFFFPFLCPLVEIFFFPMLKEWFPGITEVSLKCGEIVFLWGFAAMRDPRIRFLIKVLKRTIFAAFTCIFALGGAIVGTVVGAMKGQTTETGFFRGAGIGAVAGAITAVQLLESLADGESLSKVALLVSLVNGKVFIEWVSPAVLKAYQWQMSSLESTYREISDIYDVNGEKGLSRSCIQKLPVHEFHSSEMIKSREESSCSICLQGLKDGEMARNLPRCGHIFHLNCVDEWLSRQGTCPMCREHVFNDAEEF